MGSAIEAVDAALHGRKGGRRDRSRGVDDLDSLLLQVSFAIMMIFMMAYFLFRSESNKREEEQLLEIERQKLLIAAEAANFELASRYGLDILSPAAPEGLAEGELPAPPAILENGRLTSSPLVSAAFVKAVRNGAEDFAAPLELRRKWIDDVCRRAGLRQDAISRPSIDWLGREAEISLTRHEEGIRRAEYQAAADLQRHWIANPSSIDDPRVSDILAKLGSASDEGRLVLVSELSTALKLLAIERLGEMAGGQLLR